MKPYSEMIEEKYKGISKLPDKLLGFTSPIREKAISFLDLKEGSSVIDVGCGTGASFAWLENIIGNSGKILGVEPSRSMINIARDRVRTEGWKNITLIENTIEDLKSVEKFDGALLFAMHDVFNSVAGIKKIHALLNINARIVCVGPKTQEEGLNRIFNPMLHLLFKRMALSQENQDKPWRVVESIFTTDRIIEEKNGLIFIYIGRK